MKVFILEFLIHIITLLCETNFVITLNFAECGCNDEGSINKNCDKKTGACSCKTNWFGDKCNGKQNILTNQMSLKPK